MNGVSSLLCPYAVRSIGQAAILCVDPSRVYLPGGQEIRQILGNRASGVLVVKSRDFPLASHRAVGDILK